jgi:hypothetical protein
VYTEEFDYTAGDLLTTHGWVVSSGGGTNPLTVVAPGLTFTGYPSVTGNAVALTTTGEDDYVNFASPGPSSGSVYMSFMLNVSAAQATGDYFIALSPSSLQTNYYDRIFIKSGTTGYYVGVSKSNETPQTYGTTELTFNTTYVIVMKYVFNTGSTTDDAISIFILDSNIPVIEPSTAEINSYTAPSKNDATDLSTVTLRQGSASNSATLVVDGIRVGISWEALFLTGATPPMGWTQNLITGDPTFDYWYFNNPGGRTFNSPISSPAGIFVRDFL